MLHLSAAKVFEVNEGVVNKVNNCRFPCKFFAIPIQVKNQLMGSFSALRTALANPTHLNSFNKENAYSERTPLKRPSRSQQRALRCSAMF